MNLFVKKPRYSLIITLFTLVFSACSTLPNNESQQLSQQTPEQRVAKLQQLQKWKVTGKIAFIKNDSRDSASLSWRVDDIKGTQELNLTTYLGINVLQLNSSNGKHKIKVDGKSYQGENLEAIVYSITGLTLPSNALKYWLKGIAYQESDHISYQEITQLPQSLSSQYNNEQWQIDYANYQQINDYTLATKFSIKKDDLLIKIIINKWSIN